MKNYKFKLYEHKRNRHLKRVINTAGWIYNHCISLHKRYYRIFGKHLNCAKLQKHIAKPRKKNSFWQKVGSQAVQDICQRIEKSYQLFFKHNNKGVRPPSFKKVRKYKSFTLKQAGYKFLETLEWVARKKGKQIIYIDPWYPSSKTCSSCHHKLDTLELSVLQWRCPNCQQVNDRDKNAAKNIKMVGASTIGLGDVRQVNPAVAV